MSSIGSTMPDGRQGANRIVLKSLSNFDVCRSAAPEQALSGATPSVVDSNGRKPDIPFSKWQYVPWPAGNLRLDFTEDLDLHRRDVG